MRIIILFTGLLVNTLIAQTTNYRDTLEVEIGNGAKVIFLAQDAEDFEAIDRYDLNFIFDELWQRRQSGETGVAELSNETLIRLQAGLSTTEQEEEGRTTVPTRRRFYINISTGLSLGTGMLAFSDPFFFEADPTTQLRYEVWSNFRPSSGYEISIGTDFQLPLKNNKSVVVRTALGISNTPYQLRNFRFQQLFATNLEGEALSKEEIASISTGISSQGFDQKISMFQLFLQAVPTFQVTKDKMSRPLTYGIGSKVGLGIRDSGEEDLGTSIPVFEWGGTFTNLIRPCMQYAVVNQLEYRSFHLYAHFYPRAYKTSTSSKTNELSSNFRRVAARTHSLWSIGITVGL